MNLEGPFSIVPKYRVIFNEWKIVHSTESHINLSIGLQFHFFVKFTSYILVLWYHT